MTEYGTIKIPREDYERHNERREAAGLTWAEYIDGEAPDVSNDAEVDTEAVAEALAERFDYAAIEAAAKQGAREGVEEMAR